MSNDYKKTLEELGVTMEDVALWQQQGVRKGRTVVRVSVEVYAVDHNLPEQCLAENELLLQLPNMMDKYLIFEKPVTGTILSAVNQHNNAASTIASKIHDLIRAKKELDKARSNGFKFSAAVNDGGVSDKDLEAL